MLVGGSELIDQVLAGISSHLGDYGPIGIQVLKIIWINILLSGDNAVVIALACRALPRRQRAFGIILGAAAAVVLRIAFTVGLQFVLELPYLRFVGGVLLLYVAVKLLVQEEASEDVVPGGSQPASQAFEQRPGGMHISAVYGNSDVIPEMGKVARRDIQDCKPRRR